MIHTLFAYGTLKRNFHNHHLLEDSQYLGSGYTKSKYAMYVNGIPFVIKDEQVSHIHGELYKIDEPTLRRLDRLEGHPEWYCREQVEVVSISQEIITAWLYFFPAPNGKLNAKGMYLP